MRPNNKLLSIFTAAALAAAAGPSFSQTVALTPASVAGSTSGGATTPGTIQVVFTNGGGNPAGWQVDITYNSAVLTTAPTLSAVQPSGHFTTCTLVSPGVIRVASANITGSPPGPHVNGNVCNIQFVLPNPTAAATYPLALTNLVELAPNGNTPGQIVVSAGPQPTFSATAGGNAFPVDGACDAGNTTVIADPTSAGATTFTFAVANTGDANSTLTVQTPTGVPANNLSVTAPASFPVNIAQGAAATNFTVACQAAAAGPGTATTIGLPHNATGSPANFCFRCDGVLADTPPTVAFGTITQPTGANANVGQPANGSAVLNVVTGGAPTASVTVNCSFPTPGPANFSVTGGATRTINAGAPTGPNSPDIAVQCTRQAAAQVAQLSCTRTNSPGGVIAPLTVDFTCPVGTTSPNPAVNPASGSTIPFSGPPGSTVPGGITFTNTGGTETYNITGCTLGGASPANFAITSPTFPATVGLNGSQAVGLSCTTPANPGAPVTATLTCTTNTQLNPTFTLSCQSLVLAVPAMGMGGKALMILLVLGFGLVGFQLYRRTA